MSLHPVASGRYHPGKDKPDPKTWKANFRCALNSLSDIRELHEHSRKRGNNAFRVYKMVPSTQPQPQRRRRGEAWVDEERTQAGSCRSASVRGLCVCVRVSVSGLRLLSRSGGRQASPNGAAGGVFPATWQSYSARSISEPVKKDNTPSEDSLDNCHTPSEALSSLVVVVFAWCLVRKMDEIVVVQGRGRPNRRSRSRTRLSST